MRSRLFFRHADTYESLTEALAEFRRVLQSEWDELTERDLELRRRELAMAERAGAAAERLGDLDQAWQQFTAERSEVERQQTALGAREAGVAEVEADMRRHMDALGQRLAALAAREEGLLPREAAVAEREQALAAREAELARREAELNGAAVGWQGQVAAPVAAPAVASVAAPEVTPVAAVSSQAVAADAGVADGPAAAPLEMAAAAPGAAATATEGVAEEQAAVDAAPVSELKAQAEVAGLEPDRPFPEGLDVGAEGDAAPPGAAWAATPPVLPAIRDDALDTEPAPDSDRSGVKVLFPELVLNGAAAGASPLGQPAMAGGGGDLTAVQVQPRRSGRSAASRSVRASSVLVQLYGPDGSLQTVAARLTFGEGPR